MPVYFTVNVGRPYEPTGTSRSDDDDDDDDDDDEMWEENLGTQAGVRLTEGVCLKTVHMVLLTSLTVFLWFS